MDENKTLAEMLHVGTVYVDVRYDYMDGLEAKTDDMMLGAMGLGGEIKVSVVGSYEPGKITKEAWAELLTEMREMVARCFLFCEMSVGTFEPLDPEDEKSLDAAITELGEDFFVVGPDDAIASLMKRETRDENQRAFWQHILGMLDEEAERRGLSEEEKYDLTLGDVLDGPDEAEKED